MLVHTTSSIDRPYKALHLVLCVVVQRQNDCQRADTDSSKALSPKSRDDAPGSRGRKVPD